MHAIRRHLLALMSAEATLTLVPLAAALAALLLLPWADWAADLLGAAREHWSLLGHSVLQLIAAPALRGPLV